MPRSVEEICKALVKNEDLVASCNGFLAEVARQVAAEYSRPEINDLFTGKADEIVARLENGTAPYVSIGHDRALATKLANEGQFVIGGLSRHEMDYFYAGKKIVGADTAGAKEHKASMGHVVVIAPGGPSKPDPASMLANGKAQALRGGYPYCYQGAYISAYRFNHVTQVDAVFPSMILDRVNYAYIKIK